MSRNEKKQAKRTLKEKRAAKRDKRQNNSKE
jgi:hypothetical protein